MRIHADALLFGNARGGPPRRGSGAPRGVRGRPAGLAAGRAAGLTTVALTTTHQAAELVADVAVIDLSAVSVQVTNDGVEIVAADWARPYPSVWRTRDVRYSDIPDSFRFGSALLAA
jgi:hypothetical protein